MRYFRHAPKSRSLLLCWLKPNFGDFWPPRMLILKQWRPQLRRYNLTTRSPRGIWQWKHSHIRGIFKALCSYFPDADFDSSNGKIDKRALRTLCEKTFSGKYFESPPAPAKVATEVVIVEPIPVAQPNYVFTPYLIPTEVYDKVSEWMVTDAEHQSPLWTSLIQEPAVPPKTYQPTYVPYRPHQRSPTCSETYDVGSYTSGSSSRLSKSPSFDSNETRIETIPSTIPQSIEKGEADVFVSWEGYLDAELPPQTHGNSLSRLRHSIFTLYRRLFGIVFITNMVIFIVTVVNGNTSALHLGQIVIANFFVAILMRQDYVVNAFFNVLCAGQQSPSSTLIYHLPMYSSAKLAACSPPCLCTSISHWRTWVNHP